MEEYKLVRITTVSHPTLPPPYDCVCLMTTFYITEKFAIAKATLNFFQLWAGSRVVRRKYHLLFSYYQVYSTQDGRRCLYVSV